ncbi:serine protease [Microtetraspora sp. NBRC 13810]|uniref:S1 family peptidase n=1 Tax=Microtetraspora sp. NBRC 13810 TaxID=3030990 RepID=UPI0024A176B7|nr:S1 family peptidase [Microtetraspora sp. NBRC 13810]GLW10660.1 serine protease [Microtetraspora sp. NBRC 13810]
MIRNRLLITGAALAVATLALAGSPAAAVPADDAAGTSATGITAVSTVSAAKPPPGLIQAMQRDLGLTAEQAALRLVNEERARQTEPKLRNKLKDVYGGSWVTDTGALVVATTDTAATADISAAGAQAKVVARSLADLTAVKDKLDRASAKAGEGVRVWYVDEQANDIVVLAADSAAGEAFAAEAGADRAAVRVVASTEKPETYYDVRGGDAYYINGTSRCSVGFSVTQGTTGGFVTAGHCGSVGSSTAGYNQVAQGTFQGSSFPGNDYAWVSVNANWTPVGVVNAYGAGLIAVGGSTEAPAGSSVCRSGSTTQWHCGTIQQRNTSVTYPQGTVSQVVRTNVCAQPGDSGGSYISGNQAQGMTSGGSGNCTIGGTTYFQPVNEALTAYGLTLVTSGGPGPQPTCTGYQNTYTGSLSSGASAYQPNGSSYTTTVTGTHRLCLDGPNGTDFDIYLQRLSGSTWVNVASGTSAAPDETVTYNGTAGTYRVRVHAYSGSGSYSLGLTRP